MNRIMVLNENMAKKKKDIKPETPFQAALIYFLYRKEHRSQSWLARKIKKSPQYISVLIKGHRNGKEKTRRKIAEVFECTYNQFLETGDQILRGIDPEQIKKYKEKKMEDEIKEIKNRIELMGDGIRSMRETVNFILGALQGMGIKNPDSPLLNGRKIKKRNF